MSEYTSTTYAIKYEDENNEIQLVMCSNNKHMANLLVALLKSSGFRAEVISRSATFPEWPKARFEYQAKEPSNPSNAWSPCSKVVDSDNSIFDF